MIKVGLEESILVYFLVAEILLVINIKEHRTKCAPKQRKQILFDLPLYSSSSVKTSSPRFLLAILSFFFFRSLKISVLVFFPPSKSEDGDNGNKIKGLNYSEAVSFLAFFVDTILLPMASNFSSVRKVSRGFVELA
jgi:hypothetical protein